MYRQAIAVLTATSAALLAPAGAAHAEDEPAVTRPQCSDIDGMKINVTPPPPLTGNVTVDDVRGLMESIVAGTSLAGFFAPGDAIVSAAGGGETVPLSAAGPTPAPTIPTPSLPPLPSPLPTPTVTPAPSTPAPAATPSPALSPAAAGETASPSSRVEAMLEALVDRAIACARSTLLSQPRTQGTSPQSQGTPARSQQPSPAAQEAENAPVTRYFEALITTKPICPATTTPTPTPARTPSTLLEAIGVPSLVNTMLAGPLFCVQPDQAQQSATVSVLDSLGIIRAFDELLAS